jgi:dienelactone hydrolase
VVTANLYRPARPPRSQPGILICHSHHNPRTQGELQDMGILWARAGCVVLVMDQLGHGDRRQHPFRGGADYPLPFRAGRQDYYFRYNVGIQLHLAGDSLIGWMAWDLMRGVDLLLSRPGVDPKRILLLGAVAGGGDPAAVVAALDPRVSAVVPFNFGGAQPETRYPLPADAEKSFNYAGGGSWESTRNLYCSARDGFMPWVIVGAAAPRPLVYAHEFAWDRERDPVWKRLQTIYGWYDRAGNLSSAHGRGRVTGRPPEATHCNNIGAVHRQGIYPAFKRWFDIPAPAKEVSERHPVKDLTGLPPKVAMGPVHELAAEVARERGAAARRELAKLKPAARREKLRRDWARLLGVVEPRAGAKVTERGRAKLGGATVERLSLEAEPGLPVPLLLLLPAHKPDVKVPVVLGFAQAGKAEFLKERADDLARLLEGGVAVALPDLRGTGETRPGDGRGRSSPATALASSELMLGRTLLGARLRDLRAVLAYLRGRADLDSSRVALWGESFAPANADGKHLAAPLDTPKPPHQAEPLGGLLALLGGLYEEGVRAAYGRGGLSAYASVLRSPFCYLPYDVVVPGALTAGDLDDVAAALAPRPLRLGDLRDGLNRRVTGKALAEATRRVGEGYKEAGAEKALEVREAGEAPAAWLLARLKGG